MGLDLLISEQSNFITDDKGRNVHTVTELANFRNCWRFLDFLNWELYSGLENCGTYTFEENIFCKGLKALNEILEDVKDDEEKEAQLSYEIKVIDDFINQENLTRNEEESEDNRSFLIHAWW